jgi:hypothetical protein
MFRLRNASAMSLRGIRRSFAQAKVSGLGISEN